MAYQKLTMAAHRELVKEVENILKTDLGFLYKLAPRELGILATSLKDLVEQKKKYILVDYSRKSIDF
jgi:hypothetical protein